MRINIARDAAGMGTPKRNLAGAFAAAGRDMFVFVGVKGAYLLVVAGLVQPVEAEDAAGEEVVAADQALAVGRPETESTK